MTGAKRIAVCWGTLLACHLTGLGVAGDDTMQETWDAATMTDLIDWYDFFQADSSHGSLLLADAAKRCWIEMACERILASPRKTEYIVLQSEHLSLSPARLLALCRGDPTVFPGGDPAASLDTASQAVWYTHGHTEVVGGRVGGNVIVEGLWLRAHALRPTAVLEANDSVALSLRLLLTEQFRVVSLKGLAEFVSRGGDVSELSVRDVRPFLTIFPGDDYMKFSFSPLATRYLSPVDILVAAGRPISRRGDEVRRLSEDVFE